MRADDLSGPERRLWMGFPYSEHIDLRSECPDRVVRAEVITDLLVGRRPVDEQQENEHGTGTSPAVVLSGALITGQLNLRGINFAPPLLLRKCELEKPLVIAYSLARSVRLYDCRLPAVQGAWLECMGDLHLQHCQIDGEVDLEGACVGGQLVLSGSTLRNPGGVAVRANGLVVAGDMLCRDGAEVEGEINLEAARIGGELRFTRSTLRNRHKIALRADRMTVEKDMYCREVEVEGEVQLSSGHIKGQLNFNDAKLSHPGGVALRADHLVVGSHLYCQDGFNTTGEVDLVAARVGGEIRFSASTLSNPGRTALRADRLVVADDMYCRQKLHVDGTVSLRGAHIKGQLNFNNATLSNPGLIVLDADRLVVGSHLYCQDGFVTDGEISLVAARVGGEARFSGATLSNPNRTALQADRIFVGGDMYCRQKFEVEGRVSLRGAHIAGQLNFNDAKLHNANQLVLDADKLVVGSHLYCQKDFEVNGGISLVAARVGGEVRFSGATLSNRNGIALCADRLVVADDMYCREKLTIDGEVSLRGAHIKGSLSFSTTTVRNPGGVAIGAAQLTVGSDLSCDEHFTAEGMIDLTDAHVNGELSLSKATLSNRDGVALLAPRLIVDKDMFCRDGFKAHGTICLIGAHIAGKLSFTSAHLSGSRLTDGQLSETGIKQTLTSGVSAKIVYGASGLALVADGLRVDIDMTCDAGFTAYGEIRLKGARIGQNLDFSDAEVNNEAGIGGEIVNALDAEDMQADRMLMPAKCLAGRISLRYGKMVELDDKRGVRPDQIDITGLSYETLIPPMDPETRLKWLAKNDYEPQPYDQMARSYRQLGYYDSARKVELAQERRRRETLTPGRKAWGYLQDWTIGYGYRTGRAAVLFGLVLLVGAVGFGFFPPEPIDTDKQIQFNSIFYTLDVLVPIADFGQRDLWNSTFRGEVFKVILAIFGWTLLITAIAGINRKLTRL